MSKERELLKRVIDHMAEMSDLPDSLIIEIEEYLSKPEKQPLTLDDINKYLVTVQENIHFVWGFRKGIKFAEKHHCITK